MLSNTVQTRDLLARRFWDDGPAPERHDLSMAAYVSMMSNRPHGVLYTGATTDLMKRSHQHREGLIEGFTERYRLKRLVWFETHDEISAAIQREKRVKRWRRAWKIALIEESNPNWRDLWPEIAR